jgi:hypothetical protein
MLEPDGHNVQGWLASKLEANAYFDHSISHALDLIDYALK